MVLKRSTIVIKFTSKRDEQKSINKSSISNNVFKTKGI